MYVPVSYDYVLYIILIQRSSIYEGITTKPILLKTGVNSSLY